MSMAQQTAVMQLIKFILVERRQEDGSIKFHAHEDFSRFLQMEKEQIQEAWNDGNFLGRNGNILADYSDGNRYYKKEFENK